MTTPKCMRPATAARLVGSSGMYDRARPVYARARMDNHDLAEMWAYHDGTKHSVESVYRSGHRLEWAIMPRPFKVYPDLEPIPLPRDFTSSTRPALAALADRGTAAGDGPPLGRAALARLLYFSAGVLRRKTYAGGEIYFRAAPRPRPLYHIHLYLIPGPLPHLAPGG